MTWYDRKIKRSMLASLLEMCHFLTVSLSSLCLYSYIKGDAPFVLVWAGLCDQPLSLLCCIHVWVFKEKTEHETVLLRATLHCFSLTANPLYCVLVLCRLFSVRISAFTSAEEITQMEEETCSSSIMACCLWSLYAAGESATTCECMGEPAPRLRGWVRSHLLSAGKWTAVLLLVCCQTPGLLPCLPVTFDPNFACLEC